MTARKFLLGFTFCLSIPFTYANPVVDNVAAGKVEISASANHLQVNQETPHAIINWHSFNIASHESVHFQQPSNGIAFNRINPHMGASAIAGRLLATGNIILTNPAGIHFANSARVNVGSLLATTANIADRDFLANNLHFIDNSGRNGSVINAGQIHAADHGFVAFIAPHTKNTGKITAQLGQIHHYSTTQFVMKVGDNNLIHFAVDPATLKDSVHDKNIIMHDDKVLVNSQSAKHVLDNVVKRDKQGEASYAYLHNGNLILSSKHDIQPEHMNHDITVGMVRVKHGEKKAEQKSSQQTAQRPAADCIPVHTTASSSTRGVGIIHSGSTSLVAPNRQVEINLAEEKPLPVLSQLNQTNTYITHAVSEPSSPTYSASDSDSDFEMVDHSPVNAPVLHTSNQSLFANLQEDYFNPVPAHNFSEQKSPELSDSDSEYQIIDAPNHHAMVEIDEGYISIAPSHPVEPVSPGILLSDYVVLENPEPDFMHITEDDYVNIDPGHVAEITIPSSPLIPDSPPASPATLHRLVENFDNLPEHEQHLLSQLTAAELYLMQPLSSMRRYPAVDETPLSSRSPSPLSTPVLSQNLPATPVPETLSMSDHLTVVTDPQPPSETIPLDEQMPVLPTATVDSVSSPLTVASSLPPRQIVAPAPAKLPNVIIPQIDRELRKQERQIDAPIVITLAAVMFYLLDHNYPIHTFQSSTNSLQFSNFNYPDMATSSPSFHKFNSVNFYACLLASTHSTSLHDNYFYCVTDKMSYPFYGASNQPNGDLFGAANGGKEA